MGRLRKNNEALNILRKCSNFIEEPIKYKSSWNKEAFKNNNPIHIEIGSGKGKFIYEMALLNKNINYVAIDKYDTVLIKLAKKENIDKLNNLKIICIDANEIDKYFDNQEVDRVYLNFSDPWPKSRHAKRRLTSLNFLDLYSKILNNNGHIEFKTDNIGFFNYTVELFNENKVNVLFLTYDLHSLKDHFNIKTEYEEKFSSKGFKINKIIFTPFYKSK